VRVGVTGTPAVADYDADGRADAAVRTNDGRVVMIKSATGERKVSRSTRQQR
jgi:hypothetical protein